ncbi:YkyA family protein [Halalkalibacter krulwichiae]|uniref:Putative cell-wall binding lipoprotein n=1 Tax=Halalkalibacter krulwichiae TaxID=199441 RepID=A0A1X9MCL1_9BACI|nr:YkyA family protein [Halalkalibacter krulwichiae]ARK31175.1 Putative cell-wall binding lipoprotein [Halalkalibacter krulwichiae]
MKGKIWLIILLTLALLTLTACKEQPAEIVYQHLETAVELEEPFQKQQEPLQKAELRESEIFDEIIALGLNEMDQIIELVEEAISSIEAREGMVTAEKASIEESFDEFKKIEEEVDSFEDESLEELFQSLKESMQERFDHYSELHDTYMKTIHEDKVLFELLKDEELSIEELQDQIDIINDLYVEVEKKKEAFNESTDTYNQLKKDFYETAELNVQYQ